MSPFPCVHVWALVDEKLQKCGTMVQNFHLLARQMAEKLTNKELKILAMVAWSIWNARNRVCFESKERQPSDILRGATNLLQDYQRLMGIWPDHECTWVCQVLNNVWRPYTLLFYYFVFSFVYIGGLGYQSPKACNLWGLPSLFNIIPSS